MLLSAKTFAYSDNGRIREKNPKMYGLYDWISTFVVGITSVFFAVSFLVNSVTVVGESMKPTLQDRDRALIMTSYFFPQRGDMIVLAQDKMENPESLVPLVKRIIAIEGDTVDIDFAAGIVYVNGKALDNEIYVAEPIKNQGNQPMEFPLTVSANCVFVLGDNRNNSRDSRDKSVGLVNKNYIYGKLLARYWPVDEMKLFNNQTKEQG